MSIRARFSLCALLLISSVTAGAAEILQRAEDLTYVRTVVDGRIVCRPATAAEAVSLRSPFSALRVIYPAPGQRRASAGLKITLRATTQLDGFPAAKAAFVRAAQVWEGKIGNPIDVTIDVDFGPTRFGTPYPSEDILGSTSGAAYFVNYAAVRAQLIDRADSARDATFSSRLPNSTVPTDLGAAARVISPFVQLLALGFEPPSEPVPSVGFNSAFAFDLDPTNGISPSQFDFEAVTVHEIGHALGFVSSVGNTEPELENPATEVAPTVWDVFRFRPGVTVSTFQTAQRPMSSGGLHIHFTGTSELQMSTGRPDGTGGDEQQSSHWKDDLGIGLMDPTISRGVRAQLTQADLNAFDLMGYTIVGSGGTPGTPAPAAPTNLTASATSSTTVSLTWTDNSSNENEFRVEQKAGASFVEIGTVSANATGVNVQSLAAGTTHTFRVRASNAAGNSAYSNEASATTSGGTSSGPCVSNATTVCLLSSRFRVSVDFFNPIAGQPGTFKAARLLQGVQNPDTALFGFDSAQAVELVVRIQDTRPFAPRFDIYYGAMTDFPYTVKVTDTQTGVSRSYAQTGGAIVGGVDRSSFPASVFGTDDRIVSGGTDSFSDVATLEVDPTLLRIKAGTAVAAGSVEEAVTMTAGSSGLPALNDVDSRRHGKVRVDGASPCTEIEPNNSTLLADTLASGVPCTGNVSTADSADTITVTYQDGTTDKIEDVFKINVSSSATISGTLTFTTSSADLDFFLFRVNGSTLEILKAANGTTTTETFLSSVLTAGTYYVGVSAFSGSSNYTVTATVSGSGPAVPAAPGNLTATLTSATQATVTWTDVANETNYVVERKINGGAYAEIGTLPANAQGATVSPLQQGVTYTFRVKATNSAGSSPYSNEASVTTNAQSGPCVANATTVCLLSNRFRVSIDFFNPIANQSGTFQAARLLPGTQNPDTALFGFSNAQAVEVVVRVQDTRPFAPRFDVYYGAMTDFPYTVNVTDTVTGTVRSYAKSGGAIVGGVDRTSFPAN